LQYGRAQEGSPLRGLRVKGALQRVGYGGRKAQNLGVPFRFPEFGHSNVMPFAVMSTNSKDGTVTFNDVAKSPAYVGAIYEPSGSYAERQGPPPPGSSMGMYSRRQASLHR